MFQLYDIEYVYINKRPSICENLFALFYLAISSFEFLKIILLTKGLNLF